MHFQSVLYSEATLYAISGINILIYPFLFHMKLSIVETGAF